MSNITHLWKRKVVNFERHIKWAPTADATSNNEKPCHGWKFDPSCFLVCVEILIDETLFHWNLQKFWLTFRQIADKNDLNFVTFIYYQIIEIYKNCSTKKVTNMISAFCKYHPCHLYYARLAHWISEIQNTIIKCL